MTAITGYNRYMGSNGPIIQTLPITNGISTKQRRQIPKAHGALQKVAQRPGQAG
jgi:hypothetical protein